MHLTPLRSSETFDCDTLCVYIYIYIYSSSELSCRDRHFAQGSQISRMADYTNAELATMHLVYTTADCNVQPLSAWTRYYTRGITNNIPRYNFCASLHQRLAERSLFQKPDKQWLRIARTPGIEQNVPKQVQDSRTQVRWSETLSKDGTGQFDANVSTPSVRRQRFDAWSVRREVVSTQGQFDAILFFVLLLF